MGYIDLNVYMFVNEYFKKDKLSKRSSSLTPHSCQRTWALCGIFNQVQDSPKTDKRMCSVTQYDIHGSDNINERRINDKETLNDVNNDING